MNESFWRLATWSPLRFPRWFHSTFLWLVIFILWLASSKYIMSNYHLAPSGPAWVIYIIGLTLFIMAFMELTLLEVFFYACLVLLSGLVIVLIAVLGQAFSSVLWNMPGELISIILILLPWGLGLYLWADEKRFTAARLQYQTAQLKYHPADAKRRLVSVPGNSKTEGNEIEDEAITPEEPKA